MIERRQRGGSVGVERFDDPIVRHAVDAGDVGEAAAACLVEQHTTEPVRRRSPARDLRMALSARPVTVAATDALLVPDEHRRVAARPVMQPPSVSAMTDDVERSAMEARGWERGLDVHLEHAVNEIGADDHEVVELQGHLDTLGHGVSPWLGCLVAAEPRKTPFSRRGPETTLDLEERETVTPPRHTDPYDPFG